MGAALFNYTPGPEGQYAQRLSGGSREQTGLARSVSVLPGDTVRMEVFGKYLDRKDQKATPALLALMANLPGGIPAVAGAEAGIAAGAATSSTGTALTGLLTGKDQDTKAPPAYLNYLFFDKDKNYKYGGFVQLSEAAREDGSDVAHEKLSSEVVITEPGYLYVYLSNESPTCGAPR